MAQGAFFKASTLRLRLSGWGQESGVTILGFFFCFALFWGVCFGSFEPLKEQFAFGIFFLMFPPFQAPKLMNLPLGMEGEGVSDGLG